MRSNRVRPAETDLAHEEEELEAGLRPPTTPTSRPRRLPPGLVLDLARLLRALLGEFGAQPVEHLGVARRPSASGRSSTCGGTRHLPAPQRPGLDRDEGRDVRPVLDVARAFVGDGC